MHLSKALSAKLAAAVLVVSAFATPALAANVGTVTSDSGLNLRSQATTDAAVLSVLPYGAQVDVLSTTSDGAWHQVTYLGVTGYVSGDYLAVVAEKTYGQVMADSLNIRSGPGTEYAACGSLNSGAVVEILDTDREGSARTATEIVADSVYFAGPKPETPAKLNGVPDLPPPPAKEAAGGFEQIAWDDEDSPF